MRRVARQPREPLHALVQPALEHVDARPDLVPGHVARNEPVALVHGLREAGLHHLEAVEVVARLHESESDEPERPHALEVGARTLGDLDSPAGVGDAALVVELEDVQAGEPNVRHREVGRRAGRLEHLARPVVLGA